MTSALKTLTGPASFQLVEKKSRFVARCAPLAAPEAAEAMIDELSDRTAGHNCLAWKYGSLVRFSDDGEPSGTAGRPILAVIEGQGLDRVIVVVSRWFGGTLLGTGGLVRAYGGAAAEALRLAPLEEIIERKRVGVRIGFGDHPRVRARLHQAPGLRGYSETFEPEGVVLSAEIAVDSVSALITSITDLTRGQAVFDSEN